MGVLYVTHVVLLCCCVLCDVKLSGDAVKGI